MTNFIKKYKFSTILIILIFGLIIFNKIYPIKNKFEGKILIQETESHHLVENGGNAVDIGEINEISVSINNPHAKTFQETIKKDCGKCRENYGPFIMEKTETLGGEWVQETNPELIEYYKNIIHMSLW